MSVSITPRTVLVNTASAIDKISMMNPRIESPNLKPVIEAARKVVSELGFPVNEKLTETLNTQKRIARRVDIAQALMELNKQSLSQRYPDHVKSGTLSVDGPNFTEEDFQDSLEFDPKSSKTIHLASLNASINKIRHGHHEEIHYGAVSRGLESLIRHSNKLMVNRALANGSVIFPDINELADSMTKLATHGDYVFDSHQGMSSLFYNLDGISNVDIEFYQKDLFFKMYSQAVAGKKEIQVPLNGKMIRGESLAEKRPSEYKVSGDVPYPEHKDIILLAKAAELLEYRISKFGLIDEEGTPLTNVQKQVFLDNYTQFSNAAYQSMANYSMRRISEFTNLPYSELEDAYAKKYHAKTENFVLTHLGSLPVFEPSKNPNFSIPDAVRAISEMNSKTENSISVLSKSEFDKLTDLDGITTLNLSLTPYEADYLISTREYKNSASEMLFSYLVEKACDDVGLKGELKLYQQPELRHQIMSELQSSFPGLREVDIEKMEDAFNSEYVNYTPSFLADHLKNELSIKGKNALSDNLALNINSPSEPSLSNEEPTVKSTMRMR
jgi:hypothetical protein